MTSRLVDVSMWMDGFAFPGDQPLAVRGPHDYIGGRNREYVYAFAASTQTGTHVQGPHYFQADGERIDQIPLSRFEGPAHLVDAAGRGRATTGEELAEQLPAHDIAGEILLLRTGHMDEVLRAGASIRRRSRACPWTPPATWPRTAASG